ncbi:serine carboxypeptidase s28 domain-containing protein [Phthorimaea operculella]|nr:serine carboxypeptidase s28 domain-containing protein [Phthorimaea operculella]
MYAFGNGYRYLTKHLLKSEAVHIGTKAVKTKWIVQPLDHFDKKEKRTWVMRYFENLEFWKPNGPIFLFIGGAGEASPYFLTLGIIHELAYETKGAMFGSEHRYYGKSIPLDTSIDTENFKYLSSRQALADLAHLLKAIKYSPKFKDSACKVVVIGGSYPGNLAAWMRLLYPNIVDAAIASSAPVFAKKDFYEYIETVSDDYEKHGQDGCHDKIREVFQRYDSLFTTEEGLKQLKSEEMICEDTDMTKNRNKMMFFMDKVSEFMIRAQYGSLAHIHSHCSMIINSSRVASPRVAEDNEPGFWRNETACFDYDYYGMIDKMRDIDWLMSWLYQTCTEFGFFQSTNSDDHPFTKNIPLEIYYKMCAEIFGPDFDEENIDKGIEETNSFYGGVHPVVSKVVFVNGAMDPWSRLGIIQDISHDAPARVIKNINHCRDLFSYRIGDPEELEKIKVFVKYMIKEWIGVEHHEHIDK